MDAGYLRTKQVRCCYADERKFQAATAEEVGERVYA